MKVRKLKTRIAAFGLAVLMGISTLSSVNAFAVEQTGSEQQTEVQAVTSQKDTSVTADDITKAVSDETFAVETCMEGIHYDAEKEDVTLVSIKDENGGEYHSDKAGTYIATYMVVPKDKSDSYTITRKVTLTDTEGQAHSEENGGEKQKSDTESEDDSESPVQNYTDVEIETSEEDASAQAVKELKEDIEEGNDKGENYLLSKLYWKLSYLPVYSQWENCILPSVPESIPTEWKLCSTGTGQQ